jgi:peptide chain release factor subunit 1
MITDQNMQELLHYQPGQPTLSIYLNTDPGQGNADFYRLQLRSMLKDVELAEDANAVMHYMDHARDWSGKSIAIFSCAADGFFRAYPLAIPVRSRVRISDHPHIKPLADLLDSYGGYGVVLIDKQGGRFFHFHLGELQEQEGVMGEAIRHTKRGGGSQATGRRGGSAGQTDYVEEMTERNMRDASDYAIHFFSEKNVRRIVIGGTEENSAMFRSMLPKAWQSLVVGSFSISMNASNLEVLDKAMEIGRSAEKRRESQLLKSLITSAAKGKGGVMGLQESLDALREGRIQSLVIEEGYRTPGALCTGCGYLSSAPLETCPFCGSKMEQIPDMVELAVRQVMAAGGDVEVLHPDQTIEAFQKIGALLRY